MNRGAFGSLFWWRHEIAGCRQDPKLRPALTATGPLLAGQRSDLERLATRQALVTRPACSVRRLTTIMTQAAPIDQASGSHQRGLNPLVGFDAGPRHPHHCGAKPTTRSTRVWHLTK